MKVWSVAVACSFAALAHTHGAHARPTEAGSAAPRAAAWSFFGGFTSHELSNPGLHLGAEYPIATTSHFRSLVAGAFQLYHQPDTETGYALHARWGQRYETNFGLTFDNYLGVGLQYTRYATPVFVFRDSMATADERSESRLSFSPHLVFGLGYDFERVLGAPLALYARPGVALLYPDLNEAFQAFVVAELGLRWTPEW